MVSFADECGVALPTGPCGVEGEQYRPLPTCRECGERVCPAHVVPGSEKDRDYDRQGDGDHGPEAGMEETVLCVPCSTQEAA